MLARLKRLRVTGQPANERVSEQLHRWFADSPITTTVSPTGSHILAIQAKQGWTYWDHAFRASLLLPPQELIVAKYHRGVIVQRMANLSLFQPYPTHLHYSLAQVADETNRLA
jgi:hypothetical protein